LIAGLFLLPWLAGYELVVIVMFFAHVVHGGIVAALESIAVVITKGALHVGMAVRVVIVSVLVAMVFKVMTRSVDSIVKAPLLDLAEFARWLIPGMILV
jgi:hypothetical protein